MFVLSSVGLVRHAGSYEPASSLMSYPGCRSPMMSPGRPGSRDLKLSTKDLSRSTWRDFERLFETHPAPGAYPCWCMYNHCSGPLPRRTGESSVARTERHRREKRDLVKRGCAHG